jgi:threonine aldolase
MRQAGVIAAAALVALTTMVERLDDDHQRARRLAEVVAERWPEAGLDPDTVRTNMVIWRHPRASAVLDRLRADGVLAGAIAPGVLRMATHLDVDDHGIERACKALSTA